MKTTFSRRLALALWLLLCPAAPSWSALSSAQIWEVRAATGSDNNGGGWHVGVAGTTDYSQSATPILSVADGVTAGTTAVTSVTGGFTTAMVGNDINIVGDGIYEITAFVTTNHVTVDRNTGTATGQTLNVGGALATLGKLAGAMVASNKAFVTGAFTSTATTTFAQAVNPNGPSPFTQLVGYGTTRGDGTHALLTLSTNTGLTGLLLSNGFLVRQIDVDCGSLGTSTGISLSYYSVCELCMVKNFTVRGIVATNVSTLIADCEVTAGTSAATAAIDTTNTASGNLVTRCNVHDNTCPGIRSSGSSLASWCLITNNSGASSDGMLIAGTGVVVSNCTIHGNGRDGIHDSNQTIEMDAWRNNLLTNNGGYGINETSGTSFGAYSLYDGNAYYSNTSGPRHNLDSSTGVYSISPYTNTRDVTLTASPYVGPTTGTSANFGLNDNVGGGRSCRRAGSPGTWPGNTGTTCYLDFGAVQSKNNVRRPFLGF